MLAEGDLMNDVHILSNLILPGKTIHLKGWDVVLNPGVVPLDPAPSAAQTTPMASLPATPPDITIEGVHIEFKTDGTSGGVGIYAHSDTATYYSGIITIKAENASGWNIGWLDWIREHIFPLIGTGDGVYVNFADVIMTDAKIKGRKSQYHFQRRV